MRNCSRDSIYVESLKKKKNLKLGSSYLQKREGIIRMSYTGIVVCMMVLLFSISWSGELQHEVPELKEQKDRISYSVGYQIGVDFKKQNTDIDPDAFLKGVKDAFAEINPEISPEEMHSILLEMKKKIVARQQAEKLEMKEQRLGEGKKFLAENAKKDDVITLPSGLQYKVIRKGNGRIPGPTDKVTVQYRGTLIDGTEFGSSYRKDKPETFYVNGVIRGWTEALQLMKEGAKWQLFIPADLAFGKRGALADRVVIYDLELISVNSPE
jgi:FKBP-type peptidyl-prolyl cis-trans isomerase FklB